MNPLIRTGNYIDGQWSSGGVTYPVLNPANGELIADVQKAGAEQTSLAIDAANRALPAWRKLTAKERSQKLKRWGELMLSNQKELATLLSREQGRERREGHTGAQVHQHRVHRLGTELFCKFLTDEDVADGLTLTKPE